MTPKTVLALITTFAAVALIGCGDDGSTNNIITPVDTVAPAVPTGVALATTTGNVLLSWTPNAEPDLAGYTLERSTDAGTTWHTVGTSLLVDASYTDYKTPPGADYRVAAVDQSENQSAFSAEVGYWMDTLDPKIPSRPETPSN